MSFVCRLAIHGTNARRHCMMPVRTSIFARTFDKCAGFIFVTILLAFAPFAWCQNQLTEPVYRVANESAAVQPGAVPEASNVATGSISIGRVPLDFTQQSGEHPLAPVIRVCKASLEEIDRNIHDYSCTLVKQERVNGELGEH